MNTDEEIKKLGETHARLVAELSFKIWQGEDFRQMIRFDGLSQTEQDRIFNELEVTFIGLLIIHLESLKLQNDSEKDKELLSAAQDVITRSFLNIYKELKIDQKNLNQWETLLGMRIAEYKRDFEALMNESRKMKEFKKNPDFKYIWARVETLTLDGLSHIRRGKLDEKDPLRKYLQAAIVGLDRGFAENIRGFIAVS